MAGFIIHLHQLPFTALGDSPVLEGRTELELKATFKYANIVVARNCIKVTALPARGTSLQK